MIPPFPEFKRLELADKADVESFTKQFPPYSDFNFNSIWSWDVRGDVRISQLNGNLVVRFSDYITGEPFYSFIGQNEVSDTARTLIEIAKVFDIKAELKLIPEEVAKLIDASDLVVTEDPDNFDYICDVEELGEMDGVKYKQKRNEVNTLTATHPHIEAREIDLRDLDIKKSIITLFHDWLENKKREGKGFEEQEEAAFNKMLLLADKYPLTGVGVFLDAKLVGFMICEFETDEYVVGHASKADNSIRGTNAFLMKSMAAIVKSHGRRYFNYEQDLGLQNLRDGKNRFRPAFFLKKYTIRMV